jgi:Site-specific recombinase XerC
MQGSEGMPKIIEEKKEYFSIMSARSDKQILVKELAEIWFSHIENIMRPSSYARYHSHAVKYIIPYIGNMEVGSFNKDILLSVLGFLKSEEYKEGPLSQYTIYILEGMVRSMFRYGAENNLVPEIYFGKSEYVIANKKNAMPLPGLELHNLICVIEKQEIDLQIQIMLPLYAGLSLSEVCGLKWEDVNLEMGKIYIHRNMMRIQQETGKSGNTSTVMAECELPGNVCREFIMPGKLKFLLRTASRWQQASQESYVASVNKKTGKGRKNFSYDMQADNFGMIPPDGRTLQYRLKTAGKQAGIPGLTFQMLRDTFVVMCLQAGGDVYSIAYLLGINVSAVCERYKAWLVKKDWFLKEIG